MDPVNPQVLDAAVGTPYGGPANGVYKTADGGKTWAAAGNFPLGAADGNIRIALAPSAPRTLFAAVSDPVTDGLLEMLKTNDGGAHWLPLANVPDYQTASSDHGQGDYDSTLAVDPSNPNVVYAGGSFDAGSFLQSTDGGVTWTDIHQGADGNGVHADHHAIAFDAAGRLLDGDDGGLWRLDNATPGGIQWTDLNGGLSTIQDNSIALSPTDPNLLYGATQDNGTDVYVTRQAGVVADGGDGGVVLVDPFSPSTVYHTFEWGEDGFIERSDDGGQTWAAKVTGINTNDNARFYFPMVLDAARPGRLLMGTDHVYETTDSGEHWTAVGGPGSPGWTTTAGIDSLATAPGNANFLYASAGGHFYASTDHGRHWTQHDPVPVPSPLLRYADILVDPTNPYTVYVVAANFSDVTGGGHVWETTNGGYSWHNITGNLPDLPTWSIALDPNGPGQRDDVLYVGTDSGVYASTGLTGSWSRFGTGLPNAQVVDMGLNTNQGILAAGTHGRGVWETDARSPSSATHFAVTASAASTTAGVGVSLTVTALDVSGNVASGYTGTVTFTSADGQAGLPADYTFTAADGGTHTFTNVVLKTAGSQTVTVADQAIASVAGGASVQVAPAALDHLAVTAPATATAGVPFAVTVTAQDAFNNTVPTYTGTIRFTGSDPRATLPAAYAFVPADAGTHTFGGITFDHAGSDTATATDKAAKLTAGGAVSVSPGAATALVFAGLPATTTAGTSNAFTVTAQDAYGNTATGYAGTVAFASTDPQAVLPAAYHYHPADNGVHTGSVTLLTPGPQSVTATDGAGLTGSVPVTVAAPGLSVTESFDTTPVGYMPAGWSQWSSLSYVGPIFAVRPVSVSPPNGLVGITQSSGLVARAWLNATAPADVQVSASAFLGSAIPAQVLARGTGLNTATPTYYAASVTRGMQVQLLAVVNGVTTVLGKVTSKSYLSQQWVRVTLRVVGSTVQVQVYRLDRQQYLTAGGLWQAAPTWALSVTDTSVTGPGQVGVGRPASYAGGVYFDDFAVA
jgi:photosystem II stability/assembly factor-like uncharacterized protein